MKCTMDYRLRKIVRNNQHIISIFFASFILIRILFLMLLQIWQIYLVSSVEERLESGSLVTIQVEADNLVWKEYGREITINGEYFDVKKFSKTESGYQLTGIFDKNETAITNILARIPENDSALLELLLMGECFVSICAFLSRIALYHLICRVYVSLKMNLLSIAGEILTPPPQAFGLVFYKPNFKS